MMAIQKLAPRLVLIGICLIAGSITTAPCFSTGAAGEPSMSRLARSAPGPVEFASGPVHIPLKLLAEGRISDLPPFPPAVSRTA
jgi:hypothetical protein